MPDALETFRDLSVGAKAAAISGVIVAWLGGIWILDQVIKTFR